MAKKYMVLDYLTDSRHLELNETYSSLEAAREAIRVLLKYNNQNNVVHNNLLIPVEIKN